MKYSDAEVATMMREIGCSDIQITGEVIKSNCPMCQKKKSRCFVVLGEHAKYYCHRCKETGFLADKVWEEWGAGRRPRTSLQIVMAHTQARLCDEEEDEDVKLTSLSYVPLADKPMVERPPRKKSEPIRSVYGQQLKLDGAPKRVEAKPISESDYTRHKEAGSRYLLERGISLETQKRYGVRINTWGRRVVFPIRDWSERLVGMSQRRTYEGPNCPKCGREIGCGKDMKYRCECGALNAKYLHSKGFRKSTVLYGEWLKHEDCTPVLVEGMTDVLNLYEKGLKPPVALPLGVMGGSASREQLQRVIDAFPGKPVFIIRDSDDPEQYPELPDGVAPGDVTAEGIESTLKTLKPDIEVVHVIPGLGKDPGALSEDEVFQVVEAISLDRTGSIRL